MIDLFNAIYEHDPNVVSRSIAGETILVPIHKNVGDMESIYTLNETAAQAWELIDGQRSLAEIHKQMVKDYEIEPLQAEQDLGELIESLIEIGVLLKKQP
jgi:hypothetical protein